MTLGSYPWIGISGTLRGPLAGSCSVVQHVRPLMGQPLCCSGADAGLWGERGYGDVPTPCARVSSITLLPWLPGFPPHAFPSQSPPLHHLDLSLHSQQSPHAGIAPQSLNSSSQLLLLSWDLRPCPDYVWLQQGLSDSRSIQAATDQLSHSQPYMFLL